MVAGSEWKRGDFECCRCILCPVGSGHAGLVETAAKQAADLNGNMIGYATLHGLNLNSGAELRIAGDA